MSYWRMLSDIVTDRKTVRCIGRLTGFQKVKIKFTPLNFGVWDLSEKTYVSLPVGNLLSCDLQHISGGDGGALWSSLLKI